MTHIYQSTRGIEGYYILKSAYPHINTQIMSALFQKMPNTRLDTQVLLRIAIAIIFITVGIICVQSSRHAQDIAHIKRKCELYCNTATTPMVQLPPPPRLPLTTTAPRDGGKGGGTEGPTSRVKTTHKLMVQPGTGVIIEIGLHNQMLSPIGPNSFVLGVEASLDSIIENMGPYRKVPQTSILNAAVFDRDGLSVFQEMDGWTAASTLVVDAGLEKWEGGQFAITRQTPVATIKLGHLIDSIPEHSRLDLLKVDVQGVNYNVLAGAGDKIKRARSVFTECTRDAIKQNGFTSVELFGNEDDLCSNIRSYMETMGFVYIGHWVEGFGDASGDIAFVAKQYVDLVRSCFADEIGNINTIKDENIPTCMAKAMAGAVAH